MLGSIVVAACTGRTPAAEPVTPAGGCSIRVIVAFSHDSPNLGGQGTYTGYAVQTAGTPVGQPNN